MVGNGESFNSDVVGDCVAIISDDSQTTESQAQITETPKGTRRQPEMENSTEMQLQRTITELQNVVPRPEITITQLQRTLQSLQHTVTPNLLTPPSSAETRPLQMKNVAARPIAIVGGKCPRKSLIPVAPRTPGDMSDLSDGEVESCHSCTRLKLKIEDLQKKIKEYEGQGNPGNTYIQVLLTSCCADRYECYYLP